MWKVLGWGCELSTYPTGCSTFLAEWLIIPAALYFAFQPIIITSRLIFQKLHLRPMGLRL